MNDIVFYENFRFNEFCFQENKHRDNSHGVGYHFIGFLKEGRARLVSHDQTLNLKENDLFYIPKGCKYHSYWFAEDTVRFDSIGFLYFPTATPNGYTLQKIDYNEAVLAAFLPLSENKTVNTTSIGILYHLLSLLEPKLTPAPGSIDGAICEKLVLLMKQNPHMTIPEYAAKCRISESLLYNYVKRCTGKTPNSLRQEILCDKAAELLYTTSYTVEQICDILGFSSSAYFRKVLRQFTGKTPSQIRKESAF